MFTSDCIEKQFPLALENVPYRQLLEVHLATERSLQMAIPAPSLTTPQMNVSDIARGEPYPDLALRKYFAAKGLMGKQIDAAVAQFSHGVLDHARRALQNAYALDRLSSSLTLEELRIMGPVAQQQWSAMVAQQLSALEVELDRLRQQLAPLNTRERLAPSIRQFSEIESLADFASGCSRLFLKAQNLNRVAESAFSSGQSGETPGNTDASMKAALDSIPCNDPDHIGNRGSASGEVRMSHQERQEEVLYPSTTVAFPKCFSRTSRRERR